MRGDRECVTGVIVEPGEDLGVVSGAQVVVGEVGLPAFVGQLGLEPDVGGAWFLAWFGCDKAGSDEVTVDRGFRHRHLVVVVEVPGDRCVAGIETLRGEVVAGGDDQRDDCWKRR